MDESYMKQIEARFRAAGSSKTFNNIVRGLSLDKKAVLDIGCSYGEHLSHFGSGSSGISINPVEVTYGREHGLDIIQGNAEEELSLTKKYDAIYCNNLLEHLYSPHQFLYRMRDALAEGGLAVFGVPVLPFPNTLTRLRKFRGALAAEHINFFVADTLALTIGRAGWRVETIRGFRIPSKNIDRLFTWFYPHLYVVARIDSSFGYSEKRLVELAGYRNI